jgi:hypothetical protein
MRSLLAILLVAAMPAAMADNAVERGANSAGNKLDRAGKAIERGAKHTAKSAERPRAATQKFFERIGKKVDKATGGQ